MEDLSSTWAKLSLQNADADGVDDVVEEVDDVVYDVVVVDDIDDVVVEDVVE